jgi:hypothetical protein
MLENSRARVSGLAYLRLLPPLLRLTIGSSITKTGSLWSAQQRQFRLPNRVNVDSCRVKREGTVPARQRPHDDARGRVSQQVAQVVNWWGRES